MGVSYTTPPEGNKRVGQQDIWYESMWTHSKKNVLNEEDGGKIQKKSLYEKK